MQHPSTSDEKIQKICDALKRETIEPAQQEAARLVEQAKQTADTLIHDAKRRIEEMEREAAARIEQKQNVFEASLSLSAKQALEALKQRIERKVCRDHIAHLVRKETQRPDVIATMIKAMLGVLEKEGLHANLEIGIPKQVDIEEVTQALTAEALAGMGELAISEAGGGITLRMSDDSLTLSLSDETLTELFVSLVRDDFRKLFFQPEE